VPTSSPRLCPGCRRTVRGRCPHCTPATRKTTDDHRRSGETNPYGRPWKRNVRVPFLRANPLCVLCGALAEVPDHWPLTRRALIAQGVTDPDSFHRLRPLCLSCHARHGARDTGVVVPSLLTLVAGPPCAGKNTYIRDQAGRDDVVVDFDVIMSDLTGGPTHEHDEKLRRRAHAIRDRQIAELLASNERGWIISSAPRVADRHQYGTRVVLLLPTQTTAMERALRERPPEWLDYVKRWFERYEPDERDTVVLT
jgi:5-methylcytosine-specific restriction protein A